MTDCELVAVLLLCQQTVVRLIGVRDERLRADLDIFVIAPLVILKVVFCFISRRAYTRKLTYFVVSVGNLCLPYRPQRS